MEHKELLRELISQAIRVDATALEVEYDDGYEQGCAFRGAIGWGMARFRSSSLQAGALREQLCRAARKKRRVTVDGRTFELKTTMRDSFGESAFRVELRSI